jgi:uncharacterized membrane protein
MGLVSLWASTFTMIKGSFIVFTSVLGALILKRKCDVHNYVGVSIVVLGLALLYLSILFFDVHADPMQKYFYV